MNNVKRTFLIIIVCLVFLFSSVSSVYASEFDSYGTKACTHVWIQQETGRTYFDNNANTHTVYVFRDNICSICGHIEALDPLLYSESHYNYAYSYNGNNYHSGTRHYFEYNIKCVCGRIIGTVWRSAYCPGGSHIAPLSSDPGDEPE